jgi:hypothetical protein
MFIHNLRILLSSWLLYHKPQTSEYLALPYLYAEGIQSDSRVYITFTADVSRGFSVYLAKRLSSTPH